MTTSRTATLGRTVALTALLAAASAMSACQSTGGDSASMDAAKASPGAAGSSAQQTALHETLGDKLVNADGETVSSDVLADKEFTFLYFSAGWCGPCKRYTPTLIEFYEEHSDDVEIVLVSSDRNAEDMQAYMNDAGMPWLALPYDRIDDSGLKSTYEVRAIPRVVVLNRANEVVLDSDDVNRNEIPERVAQMLY